MGRKPRILITVTEAERTLITKRAASFGLTASAYGYVKLFGSPDSLRTKPQKHAYGQLGSALSAAQRLEILVQQWHDRTNVPPPELADLLLELNVLRQHLRQAHSHLLGDLDAG